MPVRRRVWRKAAIILASAIAIGTGAVGTTSFAANDIVGEWNHFTNCFDFMINNERAHRRNCQPNRSVPPFVSLSEPGPYGGPAPIVPLGS